MHRVAARSEPVVCFAVDECEGLQTCSRGGAQWGTQALIREWLVLNGEPLPLIDGTAVAGMVGFTPEATTETGGRAQM